MSATRIKSRPDTRSLLQTRSLRDLQAPPPPPKSSAREKSRRRVLQVNGPYVVPDVCPPIPGVGKPSRPELVQTPYVRSQSPSVSPFIVAASQSISPYNTRRRTHQKTQSSPDTAADKRARRPVTEHAIIFPDEESAHGLREPPVDPRKTRRYCSDFGLGRDDFKLPKVARPSPSPPVPDNSSLASTPLAMYTETETDSDTSSTDHALEFSFPEPPSIDDSLHLRRMRSSPMFSSEETEAVKEFLRKRWGAVQASTPKGSSTQYDRCNVVGNFSNDSGLHSDFEGELGFDRLTSGRIAAESPHVCIRRELIPPMLLAGRERNLSTPTSFPSSFKGGHGASWTRAVTPTPKDKEFKPESSPSSAQKEANTLPICTSKTPITSPSQRFVRLPPELLEPLDRLDLSIEKLRAHEPQRQKSDHAAAVPWEPQVPRKLQPPLPPNPPSLASAGRLKPMHRSHASAPLASLGLASLNDPHSSPMNLGTPFHHRSTRSQPAVGVPPQQEQPMPKSFIDITPEQETRRGMRKFLARASIGVLGWGKSLGRKKSTSK